MAEGISIGEHDVLLVVDIQNDFCPDGALAVPRGDEVVPIVNKLGDCQEFCA
jgi:nicotinamidase/pyrazinamidase